MGWPKGSEKWDKNKILMATESTEAHGNTRNKRLKQDINGSYIFLTWIGDHSPRHAHVYRKSRLVVKRDLENWQPMEGKANRRLIQLIEEMDS